MSGRIGKCECGVKITLGKRMINEKDCCDRCYNYKDGAIKRKITKVFNQRLAEAQEYTPPDDTETLDDIDLPDEKADPS